MVTAHQPASTSTSEHINQPAHQPASTSTSEHINQRTHQPASTSTSQHINQPAHQPLSTSTSECIAIHVFLLFSILNSIIIPPSQDWNALSSQNIISSMLGMANYIDNRQPFVLELIDSTAIYTERSCPT